MKKCRKLCYSSMAMFLGSGSFYLKSVFEKAKIV